MMRKTLSIGAFGLLLLAGLVACRPDPGSGDYASQERFNATADGGGPSNVTEGPDPWQAGEARLAIGAFYEGGSSDLVPIDDVTTHLYVYENTLRLLPSSERAEGVASDAIEHAGGPWWGFGVHWDIARDLNAWSTLHVSLRSDLPAFSAVEIGMNDPSATHTVQAADYGWMPDGTWNHLAIPLADLDAAGLNRAEVAAVLVVLGGPGANGDVLYIDNVYLSAAP
jgi:hypothetical protein